MTPAEGYRLAAYQRPGRIISMGPDAAVELTVRPVPDWKLAELPGDWVWLYRKVGLTATLDWLEDIKVAE